MNFPDDFMPIVKNVFEGVTASTTFSFLVAFLALYCVVLLLDIILLFILRPIGADLKKGIFGTKERPLASARTLQKEWKRIEERLLSKSPSEYKVAILEADAFTDRMLSEMGYEGKDIGERLRAIRPGHFAKMEALSEAHAVRNRVVFERDFPLDRAEAIRVITLYHAFLDEAEIFS